MSKPKVTDDGVSYFVLFIVYFLCTITKRTTFYFQIRRKDGTFNYSPDIYCPKYDENSGQCPDSDE